MQVQYLSRSAGSGRIVPGRRTFATGIRALRSLGEILRSALQAPLGFLRRRLQHDPPRASLFGPTRASPAAHVARATEAWHGERINAESFGDMMTTWSSRFHLPRHSKSFPTGLRSLRQRPSDPLAARMRYALIKTYKPVLDDAGYRSWESMTEYHQDEPKTAKP